MKRKGRAIRGYVETIGFASWLTSEGRSLVHRFKREQGLSAVPDRMLCGRERGVVAVREHLTTPKDEMPCERCAPCVDKRAVSSVVEIREDVFIPVQYSGPLDAAVMKGPLLDALHALPMQATAEVVPSKKGRKARDIE